MFVDISPSCNLKIDDKRLALTGNQIAEFLRTVLVDSNAVNLHKLCIIKGKSCWAVQIDLLVRQILFQNDSQLLKCNVFDFARFYKWMATPVTFVL